MLCGCTGMMHALPNGQMIAGPPPHMMGAAVPSQQMRAGNAPSQQQQQSSARMHAGAVWPATGGRIQQGPMNGSEQGAAVNGVKNEPPPKGRAPSGWTPVAARKLPRSCFGPRSTKRRYVPLDPANIHTRDA